MFCGGEANGRMTSKDKNLRIDYKELRKIPESENLNYCRLATRKPNSVLKITTFTSYSPTLMYSLAGRHAGNASYVETP